MMVCSNIPSFGIFLLLFQKSTYRTFNNVLQYLWILYLHQALQLSTGLVWMCVLLAVTMCQLLWSMSPADGNSWLREGLKCAYSLCSLSPPLSIAHFGSPLATAVASWSTILYVCSVCMKVVIVNIIYLLLGEHVCLHSSPATMAYQGTLSSGI